MEGPHINGLPDELLGMIFSYLSQRAILTSVLPVCRRWQAVAQSQVLSKQLVFGHDFYDNVSTEEALRLVEDIPNLQALSVEYRHDAVEVLQAVARRCRQLRRLDVADCTGRGVPLTAALLTVFSRCSEHLIELFLIDDDIADGLRFIHELGTSLSKLRRLIISSDSWFGPAELDALLDGCPNIQEFDVHCRYSDMNMTKLARRWGHTLQVLELEASELSDAGLAALAGCSQLRSLQLRSLKTPGAGLQQLASLDQLKEFGLCLSGSVQRENIRDFFRQSRSASRLRRIDLSSLTGVDDSTLAELASVCHCLEHLDVAECKRVTADRVRELLRGCRRLLRLDVSETDRSVAQQVLPEIPQLAPQLRWLDMSGLEEEDYQLMREKMPELELLRIPPTAGW